MAGVTEIDWTDGTPNPLSWRCTAVSTECDNCYAETITNRWQGRGAFTSGPPQLKPARLLLPWLDKDMAAGVFLFLTSMSDPFHPGLPADQQALLWAMMAADRWHTYQVLTKRGGAARSRLSSPRFAHMVRESLSRLAGLVTTVKRLTPARRGILADIEAAQQSWTWPLPNVWVGVSCGTEDTARRLVPQLLRTPAALRFISAEPLVGHVDLRAIPYRCNGPCVLDALTGRCRTHPTPAAGGTPCRAALVQPGAVGWVIGGGESGSRHRPLDLDWARSLRGQCTAAGVPYWFKQVGGLTPKAGGDLLDGRTWKQRPASTAQTREAA